MGYDFILDAKTIKVLYRRLIIQGGYSKPDACNLIATLMGLGPSTKGWTIKELQDILFLEYLGTNKYK